MSLLYQAFVQHPKSARFFGEDEGEKINLILRRSIITNVNWTLLGLLGLLGPYIFSAVLFALNDNTLAQIPTSLKFISTMLWSLFWLMYLFINFLNWFYNVHIVTNRRLVDMDFSGFLHRNITEAPLRSVQDVTHKISGVPQVVFNFGDVIIQTAGEKTKIDFLKVPKPAKAADIISDIVAGLDQDQNP